MTFTAGAAMINETCAVAEAFFDCDKDWEKTWQKALNENLMAKEKMSSNRRYFALVKQRLETLSEDELLTLLEGSVPVRRQMILLAICKAHPFIYDFLTENVRDAFFMMREKVSFANFNEFFNEKKYDHPELNDITDVTVAKMRQVVFRIMEQTELIENVDSGVIRRPYLSEKVERIVVRDDSKWLTIYLYSNNEINSLRELYA
jgi:predicted transcriptional regulator